jgi:hypothetical protein
LSQQSNADRIAKGEDHVFVCLLAAAGSSRKLRLHSAVQLEGRPYMLYLRHNPELPGVIIREIGTCDRILVIKPSLPKPTTLSIAVASALTGEDVMEPLEFGTDIKVRVSMVINRARDVLMSKGGSAYTPIKVLFDGGDKPISSNLLIWSPGMDSPVGCADGAGTRRRSTGKKSTSSSSSSKKNKK